ncbi:MAG: hypothetical protein IPK58_03970 [Acidobacteria bacterium]|nr:hypothetical protein [Acidobacteriota bacterium]
MSTLELVRKSAFNFLDVLTRTYGDVIPRKELERGFELNGQRIHLIGPQGIFKPKVMELPLTITTSPDSRYDDAFSKDGFLTSRYRGDNINHRDNVGLRETCRRGLPLIYFHGTIPGAYVAQWPVFVVVDTPDNLTFGVTF